MPELALIFLDDLPGVEAGNLEIEECAMLVHVFLDKIGAFLALDYGYDREGYIFSSPLFLSRRVLDRISRLLDFGTFSCGGLAVGCRFMGGLLGLSLRLTGSLVSIGSIVKLRVRKISHSSPTSTPISQYSKYP